MYAQTHLGLFYSKPGVSEKWTSTVAGLQKRDLLKEVLAQWSQLLYSFVPSLD